MTVDFKKLVSDLFHAGWQQIYQEKREAIRIALKHNNSFETFPCARQKYISLTLHCKYPAKTLWDQYDRISEEVNETTESTKQEE